MKNAMPLQEGYHPSMGYILGGVGAAKLVALTESGDEAQCEVFSSRGLSSCIFMLRRFRLPSCLFSINLELSQRAPE